MKRKSDAQRKRKKIAAIVFWSLMLFVVCAIYVGIRFFVVENVEINGNELYDDETIRENVLNDEYSWSTLYVYFKYHFLEVGEIPFIDTVDVEIKNPTTLEITVYEKGMMGYTYIDSLGKNAYFDKDGFVIEISDEIIAGVPCITGLECEDATLYQKLDITENALKSLLTATQTLEKYSLVPDLIEYGTGGAITLTFSSVTVNMGQTEQFAEKTMRLSKILPQLEGKTGVLHLEKWNEQATDITFEQLS